MKTNSFYYSFFFLALFFILLTLIVSHNTAILAFDLSFSQFIQQYRDHNLTFFMKIISVIGSPIVISCLSVFIAFIFYYYKKKSTAIFIIANIVIGAGLINYIIKHLVCRARPAEIDRLVSVSGYSFPSGHTTGSCILIGSLIILSLFYIRSRYINAFIIILGIIFISLVGISRVYLGAHYPTDIIGAMIISLCWLLFSYHYLNKLRIKHI